MLTNFKHKILICNDVNLLKNGNTCFFDKISRLKYFGKINSLQNRYTMRLLWVQLTAINLEIVYNFRSFMSNKFKRINQLLFPLETYGFLMISGKEGN